MYESLVPGEQPSNGAISIGNAVQPTRNPHVSQKAKEWNGFRGYYCADCDMDCTRHTKESEGLCACCLEQFTYEAACETARLAKMTALTNSDPVVVKQSFTNAEVYTGPIDAHSEDTQWTFLGYMDGEIEMEYTTDE